MVKVTDKDYYLDGFAEQVCQAVNRRVKERKQDIVILMDGREGSGKTNASVCLAYRIADLTGRTFNVNNVFFDLDEMIKFAGTTKEQVIVWDESALGGLAQDWTSASQRKLKSMLMVCRKLRHVFFFNVPRFYRLSSDIIERAYCMFHTYENKEEKPGNFMFFGMNALDELYENWKKRKKAYYWSFKKLHGCFQFELPKLIDEEIYEKNKDEAIKKLATTDKKKVVPKGLRKEIEREIEAKIIKNAPKLNLRRKDVACLFEISPKTVDRRKESVIAPLVS